MLDVAHISFAYGTRPILKDITFDVAPGEIVALTGPNGAGKTTLLKVLACLLMQDAGTVHLHGVDTLQRPIKYCRTIGYLSAHNPLYNDMTVEEYLTYRVRLRANALCACDGASTRLCLRVALPTYAIHALACFPTGIASALSGGCPEHISQAVTAG